LATWLGKAKEDSSISRSDALFMLLWNGKAADIASKVRRLEEIRKKLNYGVVFR
jgi:hypothetical protein